MITGTTKPIALSTTERPSNGLQWMSAILPLLKCAICPACLSVWTGVAAGARVGFFGDEGVHHSLLVGAIVLDIVILQAARAHHQHRGPILMCIASGGLAVTGHETLHAMEYAGLFGLFVATMWNLVLLRRVHARGDCCGHAHHLPHGHVHGSTSGGL